MAPAPKPKQAKLVQMGMSYSVGTKVNLGDFESADFRLSRDEKWDVTDLTPDQAKALYRERYETARTELGDAIEWERDEVLGNHLPQIEERDR
jgi:hypothetical protein